MCEENKEMKLNIWQKLQEARCKLQDLNLKKSGLNQFAKYSYYELGDILPAINNINKDIGLCTHITFNNEFAVLNIINSDNGESISFTSPMAAASLKGAHDIQNLGATETYQRRYLYLSAYEIVEHDAVDSSKGKAPKKHMSNTNLDYYINELEMCDSVQCIVDLWENATEKFLPHKDFKEACSQRRSMIENGDLPNANI